MATGKYSSMLIDTNGKENEGGSGGQRKIADLINNLGGGAEDEGEENVIEEDDN